jgi:hypothetical protein
MGGCSPARARVPARSGLGLHVGGDTVLLGACRGDDEVRRGKASSMVVVAWTNLSRGLAEGWLKGSGVCGDVGSIAAAWGHRDRRCWYEVREGGCGIYRQVLACARG